MRIEGETDYEYFYVLTYLPDLQWCVRVRVKVRVRVRVSEYFYVLTYLPDLQWCHVGPLEKRGVFPPGSTRGRPGYDRWMLVPEEMGGGR